MSGGRINVPLPTEECGPSLNDHMTRGFWELCSNLDLYLSASLCVQVMVYLLSQDLLDCKVDFNV